VDRRWAVALIGLTAFIVRLLHVVTYERFPMSDEVMYVDIAVRRLALGNLFNRSGLCSFPVGYPVFLRIFYLLFGASGWLPWAEIGQAGLGAITCVLIYRLATRIHSRRAGLAAMLLACFHAHAIFYGSLILSENLFTPLYLGALLLLLRSAERPRMRRLYVAGLMLGATAMVRPAVASIAPAVIVACWKAGRNSRKRLAALLICALGGLTIVGPWAVRNWIAYDRFVLIAPNGPLNFFIGNHPDATGRFVMPPEKLLGRDPMSVAAAYTSEAMSFIRRDPLGAVENALNLKWHAFWEFLQPWLLNEINPQRFAGEAFFPLVSWRFLLILGTLGAGILLAGNRSLVWLTPACFGAYFAFYLVYFANARFRLPAESLFVAWSGITIAHVVSRIPFLGRARSSSWSAAILTLLAVVLVSSAGSAAYARAVSKDPSSVLARSGPISIKPDGNTVPVFGKDSIPLNRLKNRYLVLSFSALREGPEEYAPNLGQLRMEFFDEAGNALDWHENSAFYLQNLPRHRTLFYEVKSHIPVEAFSCRVSVLTISHESSNLTLGPITLRYAAGNDLAGEFLFPYLSWGE
jgi:4-amino-4-deoxy-L-arabinose transferase-like glycosyltransferase